MAIVFSNDGRRGVLGLILPYLNTLTLRLFVLPLVPIPDNVAVDFVEPTYNGYAPQALNHWSGNFLNLLGQGEVDEVEHIFAVAVTGGSDIVQGYFVTDPNGYVVWSELEEDGPVPMNTLGNTYSIVPRLMSGELC